MMFLSSGSQQAPTSSLSLSLLEKELQLFEEHTKAKIGTNSTSLMSSPMSHTSLFAAMEDMEHFREQRRQDQDTLNTLRHQTIVDPILMKFEHNRLTYDRFHEVLEAFQDEHRGQSFLSIDDFLWMKTKLPSAAANKYFTAKNFIFLGPNDEGHVHIRDFEQ